MIEVKPIDNLNRLDAISLVTQNWGSAVIVSKGQTHLIEDLPGFLAYENGIVKGLITYRVEQYNCEIVSLDSLDQNRGIGTILINIVLEIAKDTQCKRVWLITTNDNCHAIRYYQKRGFNLINIYINAVNESRKIKPQIPLYGFDNIPILHEIEFELLL